jgi:predicted MPP superfamily phosphohydrolase
MISRRAVVQGASAFLLGGVGLAGYALGIEPHARLSVARYQVTPSRWPAGVRLRLAVIADLHACEPWVGVPRIRQIVDRANSLDADVILLLGDYAAGHRWVTGSVHSDVWARELGRLTAPLGVHAVLGNHDWWDDLAAQRSRRGPVVGRRALERAGIPVYENDSVRLDKGGRPFWLAGLGDQWAFGSGWGVDDLSGTLAKVTDDAPVILLAHEPDIFPRVPERVSLTLSGHTHGGQVRLFGYSPAVPSRFGNRYAYGHIVESDRHLIVSGGLGCAILPVRIGVPPEIVLVDVVA